MTPTGNFFYFSKFLFTYIKNLKVEQYSHPIHTNNIRWQIIRVHHCILSSLRLSNRPYPFFLRLLWRTKSGRVDVSTASVSISSSLVKTWRYTYKQYLQEYTCDSTTSFIRYDLFKLFDGSLWEILDLIKPFWRVNTVLVPCRDRCLFDIHGHYLCSSMC